MLVRTLKRLADRYKHRDSAHQHLFEPYRGHEVISIDCEMTGLDVKQDEIISLAAVRIEGHQIHSGERLRPRSIIAIDWVQTRL